MKKSFLFAVLFSISAFLCSAMAGVSTPINEVITERGSNCYTAVLKASGEMEDITVNLITLIVRQADAIMTSLSFSLSSLGLAAVTGIAILSNIDIFSIGEAITIAPIALAWVVEDKFVKLTPDQIKDLSDEDTPKYMKALSADQIAKEEAIATKITELGEENETNKEELASLKAQLNGIDLEVVKTMLTTIKEQGIVLAKMKDQNVITEGGLKTAMKAAWDSKLDAIKEAHDDKKNITVEIKATQTFGDITEGEDLAQMKPGITDIPTRRPNIRNLFGTIPMTTEFLKFTEQDTVVRDAQNVAKCAAVVSTTKETIIISDISTKVIKDQIDFCRLFIADYPFMESRINKLINDSIALRVDEQLLLGDGTGENTFSIDSVSSTFNAANAACDIALSIQAGTYVDLILGMETQIFELGQQNAFIPNVVLVNKCDWFIFVQSRKDLNNNYLDARVTMVNGVPFVGGMMVLWSTLVPQNELYVFDATKGEVVDRQSLILEVAFENKDNWEKQIASLQGYVRLNFLVESNNANAFMHAPDVAAAITAITI